jgi:hypothetical protein
LRAWAGNAILCARRIREGSSARRGVRALGLGETAAGACSLRARIPADRPGVGFWPRFKAGQWYAAESDGDEIRLIDGRRSRTFRRDEVEVRPVADDQWEIRSAARAALEREGQSIDYPTRVAECPHGHNRPIPTRFDEAIVELRCKVCDKSYRLIARS